MLSNLFMCALYSVMNAGTEDFHHDNSYIYRYTVLCKCFRQGCRNWGGGAGGAAAPPCLLLGGARGAKVPFKFKEYYITVSFQGAFS